MSTRARNPNGSRTQVETGTRADRLEVGIAAAIFATALVAFAAFALRNEVRGMGLLGACAIFTVFFGPCLALSVGGWREALAARLAPSAWMRLGALWILALLLYSGYAAWQGAFAPDAVGRLALYGAILILLAAGRPPARPGIRAAPGRVALALPALWLPLEFGLVGRVPLPAGPGPSLDCTTLAALGLGLTLLLAVWRVPDIGYRFRLAPGDLARAGLALAAFALVAVPLGLGIGFLAWNPAGHGPLEWGTRAVGIYFLTAVPEELVFRGLLQNILEKRWPARPGRALLGAAVIFGAAHLNNPPAPNWPYLLLASLAGLAYGWVWMRTRRITASALTHMAVDLAWVELLHR